MLPSIVHVPLSFFPSKPNMPFSCINPFGAKMVKNLNPESNKFSRTTMSLGHMVQLAMERLRQWLNLWYTCSAMLVRAVSVGIAKGAMSILEMSKGKREDVSRNKNKFTVVNGQLRYLILNQQEVYSQPDLVGEIHFGGVPEQHLISEIDKMYLEEEDIFESCFISRCISLDSESGWEDFSENSGLQGIRKFGISPQKCMGNCYHPQTLTESLDISQCIEETLCWSQGEELKDFEGFFSLDLERPSVSQSCKEDLLSDKDLAVCDRQSFESLFDPSKAEEQPVAYKKSDNEGIQKSEMSSCDFKSSLVHSLFYSPLEDEEDNSEDWSSEDELEESNWSSMNSSINSESENTLIVEEDTYHQDVLENLPGSFLLKNDPFHSLGFSKKLEAQKAQTPTQKKPQSCKDITVSFYLREMDFKPKEPCGPLNQLWPQKNPRVPSKHSTHKCCQLKTSKYSDCVATETSGSQKENQVMKKVRFSPVVTIHPLVVWDYAARAARRGPWEEMARDRCRFRRRIGEVGRVLEPCLEVEHRAKIWKKIHGPCDSLEQEETLPLFLRPLC